MADLRINGWSDESLKCQPDLDQKFYLTLAGKSRFRYQNIGGFGTKLYVHSSFATIWFVFLVYREGCVALPRGAMGLSSVCDCGIF